ncbi:MAG: right-handed parallel beta-helix repeat-containing protein [Kofleriaceae bacterium]
MPATCLALAASTAAQAETFHVSGDGDDGAAGTAEAPWRSLQHAADRVAPGDIVEVAAGDYAGMYLETSGTEAQPIVFRAAPGATVTGDNEVTTDGINLEGVAWVTVAGFTVEGATRAGIRAVLCDHVSILDNRTDGNGRWGILTGFCDDLLIEGNEASRSVAEHGIYVSNSGDRPVVRGNLVWGNHANGLHINGDADAGGDGVISDAIVEGNTLFGNGEGGGSAINCDGVQNAVIANNLIYGNRSAGIALYRIDGGAASTGNLVVNNTIVMPDGARWGVLLNDGAIDNTIRNNVILHGNAVRGAIEACLACLPGLVSDHNAVTPRFSIGEEIVAIDLWQARTGQEVDSFAADASLFLDAAGDDYRLAAGAAAIDVGSPDGAPLIDLAGNARPQGGGVDLGAFEDCAGAPCAEPSCVGAACVGGLDDPGGCCQGGRGRGGAGLLAVVVGVVVGRRRRRRA